MEGRVAIVTGAGRGIGRATALALASRGARVLGVSRTEDELASLAEEAPIEVVAESVATEEGCERIVGEARGRLGPVEILVLNAGIGSGHEREIWAQETGVWRESMAVNLDGPFFLCRAVVRRHEGGRLGAHRHGQLHLRRDRVAEDVRLHGLEARAHGAHALGGAGPRALTARRATPCCRAGCGRRWPSAPRGSRPSGEA